MATQLEDPADSSIGDLFHQLADDASALFRAEANLYKQVAQHRVGKARNGIIAILAGAVLGLVAVIVLLVMLAIGLATLIGPVAGGLIVAGAAGVAALLLVRWGAGGLGSLGGDEEERAALVNGERKA